MQEPIKLKTGVELHDPSDHATRRNNIYNSVKGAANNYIHGTEYGGVRMELEDLHYVDPEDYDIKYQKEALLADKTITRRLRGTVKLVDTETNEVLDKRDNFTIAAVPHLTERGTMIHNGNEYGPISQSRLLPGAYTRRKENGTLETHFNVRPGTGSAMRVSLNAEDAQFRLQVGSSNVHAYSVFKDLGISDDELEDRWGADILEMNKKGYDIRASNRVFDKVVPAWKRDEYTDASSRLDAIREAMESAQSSKYSLSRNLPNMYDLRKSASWRAAHYGMDKAAGARYSRLPDAPNVSAENVYNAVMDIDFDLHQTLEKTASFEGTSTGSHPLNRAGHWMQTDPEWIDWLSEVEHNFDRVINDPRKVMWKEATARCEALYNSTDSEQAAYELLTWGVLLDDKMVKKAAEFRSREYMKHRLRSGDLSDTLVNKIASSVGLSGEEGAMVALTDLNINVMEVLSNE